MPEHRVPLLGDAWHRREDPERSRDPRVQAVVRELSLVSAGPAPAPVFRAELRAQLVAITPRLVAESIAAETAMVDIVPRPVVTAAPKHAQAPARRRFAPGRVLAVTATVVTVFALLLGGAVVLSRRALPGDTLYGLKRASERFQLATDGSDTERATDLLSFARTRTEEARQLLGRTSAAAAGPGAHAAAVSDGTATLITQALHSADSDVADASSLLSGQAVADGSAAPLTNMTTWAKPQLARLTQLRSAMPDTALRSAVTTSITLVTRAQARATTLIPVVGKASCLASSTKDTLGPKPCSSKAPVITSTPSRTTRATTAPSAPIGRPDRVKPVTGSPVTVPTQSGLGPVSTPRPSGSPLPIPSNLPTQPVSSPTPPIVIGSCGLSAGLGGIHIGIGTCSGAQISLGP